MSYAFDVMVDQEVRILELLNEIRELKRLNSEISAKYEYLREKTKEKEVE